jgi:hypothetical protein
MRTDKNRIKTSGNSAEAGIYLARSLNARREPSSNPRLDRVSLDAGKTWTYSVADPKGKGRIITLIRLILDLEGIVREHRDPTIDFRAQPFWRPPKQIISLKKKLDRILSGYKSSPDVMPAIRTGTLEWDLENAGRRTNGEVQMAGWVIELSKSGFLNRVRLCRCGQWFFARRCDSFTCSAKCRNNEYENTEARIEKRRENARQYYWLHKSGKVK